MADPRRESPLHPSLRDEPGARGPADARFGAVTLAERPHLGHYALRGRHDELAGAVQAALALRLPEVPNTVAVAPEPSDLLAAWLSPSEWLLVDGASPRDGRAALSALAQSLPADRAALVDLSSAQTVVAVGGPGARDVLGSGCPLDLHPHAFPPGACAQTHLAKAPATLVCRAGGDEGVDVVVRRSYAPYVWGWLMAAAADL